MAYHVHTDKPQFEIIIADKNISSWSMRAWLVAVQSGLPFKETCLAMSDAKFKEKVTKASPSAKVPALKHGKTIIWDSLAISEYLNELSPEAHLWPQDPALRALARAYTAEVHSGFSALRSNLPMDIRNIHKGQVVMSAAKADIDRLLGMWKSALTQSKGPYLFGDFSIADAFMAPFVLRFKTYDIKFKDKGIQMYCQNILGHHGVQFWLADVKSEKMPKNVF